MSVTSYNGLRPGGDSLVSGTSFSNNSKKTHLLSSSANSNAAVSRLSVNDMMAAKGGNQLKSHNTNLPTPPDSRGSNAALPVIKVTPAAPANGGGGSGTPVVGPEVSSTTPASSALPKAYGKIVLTLENVLLPNEKLTPTPSLVDGLDEDSEMDLRIMGCELITAAGILLKVPQTAMATGQVLFQRFYYSKSFIRQPMEPTAMACIYLASKIEEAPRRIRDVVNVFHHIKLVRAGKPIQPMILDTAYIRLKNDVTLAERRVLKELGFCVHVKHPHKLIVIYLQQLTYDSDSEFVQLSWNYMSDALRSNVFVRYTPEAIACACIYLSARRLKIPLPNNPPWFVAFDATEAQMIDICETILALYERPKVNYELLEKKLEQLIKVYQDSKQKSKSGSSSASLTVEKDKAALDTPTSASPHSRPVSPQGNLSNAPSSTTTGNVVNNGKEKGVEETKDRRREESGKPSGKRSAVNSPEPPAKRSRRTPSPAYDDSPKRHKSKKRKKTSSRYARSYSSSRSRSRSRERKSSKKRSRRPGRSRSRSYTPPPPPKRHHHHKHKSHRR